MSIESFKDGLGNQLYRMTLADADPVLLEMVQAFYRETKLMRSTAAPIEPEPDWPSDRTAKWILPESGTPEPSPGMAYPPNCDGMNCAEVLTERTAGDD